MADPSHTPLSPAHRGQQANRVVVDYSQSDDVLRRRRMPMFTTDLEVVRIQADEAAEGGEGPAATAETFAYIQPAERFEDVPLEMFDLALSSLRKLASPLPFVPCNTGNRVVERLSHTSHAWNP